MFPFFVEENVSTKEEISLSSVYRKLWKPDIEEKLLRISCYKKEKHPKKYLHFQLSFLDWLFVSGWFLDDPIHRILCLFIVWIIMF